MNKPMKLDTELLCSLKMSLNRDGNNMGVIAILKEKGFDVKIKHFRYNDTEMRKYKALHRLRLGLLEAVEIGLIPPFNYPSIGLIPAFNKAERMNFSPNGGLTVIECIHTKTSAFTATKGVCSIYDTFCYKTGVSEALGKLLELMSAESLDELSQLEADLQETQAMVDSTNIGGKI